MPYKSKAQQKYFHYLESKGKMPKKTVKEFDEATDYEGLPEHVKMAMGGMVPHMEHGEEEAPHDMEQMPSYAGSASRYQMGDPSDPRNEEMMPHLAEGGIVPDYNFDYNKGNQSEYDSSGEPHTEFEKEDEKPMEFMAMGGRIGKMSSYKAPRPAFVKALKRMR